MIVFKDFSFRYEERERPTLRSIDLEIADGECVLLTGRSGCGKTTLIRSLNGLIPHFYPGEIHGTLELDGESLLEKTPSELAGRVGTVFQDPRSQFFMTDTTRELAFGCENLGLTREKTVTRVAKAVRTLSLENFLGRSIFSLSSGEKQQIAIGSVYAMQPRVVIFDEPSANLDHAATHRLALMMAELKRAGVTLIIVEYRFYYLRDLIDRAYLIQDGRITRTFSREAFSALSEAERVQMGLRTVYPERETVRTQKNSNTAARHTLVVESLGFAYKGGPPVLSRISFEARSGEVVGVIGHNGAGKTTLLSLITGLLKEQHGRILFDGEALSVRQRRALSYLVLQDTDYQLFAASVEEELSLGHRDDVSEKIERVLAKLGLSDYRAVHPAALSGGQKQRVTIGAAIVAESPLIVFDEPTSGLDYDSMVRVSALIEKLARAGVIVFVVSHDFEFIARTASRIVQLDAAGAVTNEALTPTLLATIAEKYFSLEGDHHV